MSKKLSNSMRPGAIVALPAAPVELFAALRKSLMSDYYTGNFLFEILIQTRTKTIWFANAKVEPGFEREGPSTAPQ
jgi:hypothetical protein